jgi:hypothetical protein
MLPGGIFLPGGPALFDFASWWRHFSWEKSQGLSMGRFSPWSRLKPFGRVCGLDKSENLPYPQKNSIPCPESS